VTDVGLGAGETNLKGARDAGERLLEPLEHAVSRLAAPTGAGG
jgi:hypothetical protein